MRRRRALIVGPTPPPIGGDTVSTRKLLTSGYWNEIGVEPRHVNTSAGDRLRVVEGRLEVGDIARGVGIFMRVLSRLPGTDVVLLWVNSRFLCTLGVPIILVSSMMRRPVVVKVFGEYLAERIRRLSGFQRRFVMKALQKVLYMFPQTERMAEELVREFGLRPERVVCLPNYLPDAMLAGEFRERRFTGRCIFVGQIKREKGVFDILEALAGAPDFTCDLFGPVLERDRKAFLEKVARAPNIEYRGIAQHEDVSSLIDKYDVLLLPSYHEGEGYPAVVLEAFAVGVPVVAADWKSVPKIVADNERGMLVPVRSPDKIREALERLGRDSSLYGTMSRNAFDYARSYSEKAVVRDVLMDRLRRLFVVPAD
jgi:glycosyltransferase involved in cell wall biosynthesis